MIPASCWVTLSVNWDIIPPDSFYSATAGLFVYSAVPDAHLSISVGTGDRNPGIIADQDDFSLWLSFNDGLESLTIGLGVDCDGDHAQGEKREQPEQEATRECFVSVAVVHCIS